MRNNTVHRWAIIVLVLLLLLPGCAARNDNGEGNQVEELVQEPTENQEDVFVDINEIDVAEAEQIALDHAGIGRAEITDLVTKRDNHEGRHVYEVKFFYNGKEYEYKIDVAGGDIIEAEDED